MREHEQVRAHDAGDRAARPDERNGGVGVGRGLSSAAAVPASR